MSENERELNPAFAEYVKKRPTIRVAPLSDAKPYDVHFVLVEIPPGETAVMTAHPQCLFRGKQMLAYSDDDKVLDDLHMTQMFVGKKCQLPLGTEAVSFRRLASRMSSEDLGGHKNGFDTVDVALSISVCVVNRGSVPRAARLLIMGVARL